MRAQYLMLLLAVSLTSSALGQTYKLPTQGRFILASRSAKEIFDQCSRDTPSEISQLWQPSPKDIDELEGLLQVYLANHHNSGKAVPPVSVSYHRQYVGFMRNGERFIYANFYPGETAFASYESKTAVMVCDGGPAFWGIVYRVKTKNFEEPRFNGVG